jgi:regulatory protein YycH of two-component signal transduction system YycFG
MTKKMEKYFTTENAFMNIKEYIASQLNEEQTKAALYKDTSSLIIA